MTERTIPKHECSEDTCYLGCCPECNDHAAGRDDWGNPDGWPMVHVYKWEFGICPEHRIRWDIGYGLFSFHGEVADWREALELWRGYRNTSSSDSLAEAEEWLARQSE